jgi:hypothetical protein
MTVQQIRIRVERYQLTTKIARARLNSYTAVLTHREDGRDPLETALLGREDDENTDELAETGRGLPMRVDDMYASSPLMKSVYLRVHTHAGQQC